MIKEKTQMQPTVSLSGNLPRVLMVGPGRDVRGGVSTVVNNYYALGLDRQIDLTYLTSMKNGSKLRKALVFAQACLRFNGLMKQADILHVHLSPRASFARKAVFVERAHRMGKKIIIHQHGGNFHDFYYRESSPKKQEHIRRIFHMADHVIVLSEEWQKFFANGVCDPGRITVIHNGVIPPEESKTDYEDHQVLYLGLLNKMKGTDELLEAVPSVVKEIPDAVFHLCGSGNLDSYRRRAEELGVAEHIRFPGWIDASEREKLFSVCSTFILPSHIEGMPMSLLEAMGNGLASVATSVGGIPQIITNEKNGLLIPPEDPAAISCALLHLLSDRDLKKRIGTAGASTVRERFHAAGGMKQILDIYRELAG